MLKKQISKRTFLGLLASLAGSLPLASRNWFALAAETPLSSPPPASSSNSKIGLALGAGGANGLAHILMLEAFDELGIKPHRIAGSSIGAVIGALYASGISAKELKEIVNGLVAGDKGTWIEKLADKNVLKWIDLIDLELGSGGLVSSEGFLLFLLKKIKRSNFDELEIPLKVVATDFWRREEVIIKTGKLLPAIQASTSIPGVFTPVLFQDKALIDGGAVNPLPYDLLLDECEVTVAIEVTGKDSPGDKKVPSFFDAIFNTFQIMQQAITHEKMEYRPPDIYIETEIVNIRTLEFYRAEEVYKQAQPAKEKLKRQLDQWLTQS
ncbi:Patatin [Nitrosococcus halophilus Nc 4]|uniref:Patatin n=1 Tax=Nitrosococcus halophilus (strain Nc4) TaxID=472759 RepID=D5C2A7_NITHN|nr:patatin-like phospholipase family protein [Nitrosococcus halophilus]ADE14766.1 Patatin [Nitrosococcus halophilus Nc 4]